MSMGTLNNIPLTSTIKPRAFRFLFFSILSRLLPRSACNRTAYIFLISWEAILEALGTGTHNDTTTTYFLTLSFVFLALLFFTLFLLPMTSAKHTGTAFFGRRSILLSWFEQLMPACMHAKVVLVLWI